MFHREAGYMPATGYQIIRTTSLRTGLGPYMHPNFWRSAMAAIGRSPFMSTRPSTCAQIWHMCRFCTHLSNGRFDEPQIFSNQGFRRATCRIVSSCLRTMPSGRALCKRRISENNHSRFVGSMSR
jgi:hypothetical protein